MGKTTSKFANQRMLYTIVQRLIVSVYCKNRRPIETNRREDTLVLEGPVFSIYLLGDWEGQNLCQLIGSAACELRTLM